MTEEIDNKQFADAIKQIAEEKNIPKEKVVETIEAALAAAFRKDFGEKDQNIKVEFNPDTGQAKVFDSKKVIENKEYNELVKEKEEAKEEKEGSKGAKGTEADKKKDVGIRRDEPRDKDDKKDDKKKDVDGPEDEKEKKWDLREVVPLKEAKKSAKCGSASGGKKKTVKVGDEIKKDITPSENYGRIAAQTAKQVIIQRLREAEREAIYEEYKNKEGEVLNAIVQRIEGRAVYLDIGHTAGLLLPQEQIRGEHYSIGQRLKVYLVEIRQTPKGPEIILSRSHPQMVKKLFELEVPEVYAGTVKIRSVAREAGSRTKIAVASIEEGVDPVGSCVGQRGTRVQTIITELGGEKIDIIEWEEEADKFITNALAPAKVIKVEAKEKDKKEAKVYVNEDQLSLAIGKDGQNVRLAAKLTGWKIDVVKGEEEGDEKKEGAEGAKGAEADKKKDDKKEDEEEKKSDKDKKDVKKKDKPKDKDDKKDKKKKEEPKKKDVGVRRDEPKDKDEKKDKKKREKPTAGLQPKDKDDKKDTRKKDKPKKKDMGANGRSHKEKGAKK